MVSSGRGPTSPEPAGSGAGEEEEGSGTGEEREPQKRRERRRHSPGVATAVKGIDWWRLKRGVEAEVVDWGERREEMDKGRLKSVCRGVVMARKARRRRRRKGCCIVVVWEE